MAVRTGEQYLEGLSATSREIWLGDERVDDVVTHPLLRDGALAIAAYYDAHHEHPDDMIVADPDNGEPMAASHMLPRSVEDLKHRHRALRRAAELSLGTMGRTPDYMNITFAGFAMDRIRWAGAEGSNQAGYENLVEFQRRLRRDDLSLTHTIVHPTVDKATDNDFTTNPVPLHKVGETSDAIIVRGARMLATLAPFADEQTVYPGAPLTPGSSPAYALAFTVAMDAPGLVFLCRDSGTSDADPFDMPFSTRFDEQDAYCIFDDVEIPKQNVFIDGDIGVYNTVMHLSPWWANIMQQTTIRALTKLEFLYRLAGRMAEAVNDTSEQTIDMIGEIQTYVEMTRTALLCAEDRAEVAEDGGVFPEARAIHPARALIPKWMVRTNEILRTIGGANLLATPSRRQLDDPRIAALCDEFIPGAGNVTAEERAQLFRLAWDFIGTTLGSRNELYERHYLGSPKRTHTTIERLYAGPNRERGDELIDRFLTQTAERATLHRD
jgi:4-hydroxyphenylacetate 3-monooxygenase